MPFDGRATAVRVLSVAQVWPAAGFPPAGASDSGGPARFGWLCELVRPIDYRRRYGHGDRSDRRGRAGCCRESDERRHRSRAFVGDQRCGPVFLWLAAAWRLHPHRDGPRVSWCPAIQHQHLGRRDGHAANHSTEGRPGDRFDSSAGGRPRSCKHNRPSAPGC